MCVSPHGLKVVQTHRWPWSGLKPPHAEASLPVPLCPEFQLGLSWAFCAPTPSVMLPAIPTFHPQRELLDEGLGGSHAGYLLQRGLVAFPREGK